MNARTLIQTLAFAALVMTGCGGYQHYQPLTVQIAAAQDTHAAARELATRQGWSVIDRLSTNGRLVAFADETATRRDRIVIHTRPGNVRIAVYTELRDNGGEWFSSDTVCPSYSYAREHEVAQLLRRITNGRTAQ